MLSLPENIGVCNSRLSTAGGHGNTSDPTATKRCLTMSECSGAAHLVSWPWDDVALEGAFAGRQSLGKIASRKPRLAQQLLKQAMIA